MIKPRTRAGTYATFIKRYGPIPLPGQDHPMRELDDLDVDGQSLKPDGHRYVWTLVSGDSGDRDYLVPGFAFVNRMGYVLCERPWPDEEQTLPGYAF